MVLVIHKSPTLKTATTTHIVPNPENVINYINSLIKSWEENVGEDFALRLEAPHLICLKFLRSKTHHFRACETRSIGKDVYVGAIL